MKRFDFLKRQIILAHVSGIPVRIDLRWFIVFAFMTVVTAANLTGSRMIESFPVALVFGAVTTAILFASILVHEYGHSIIARREGVEVLEIVLHPFGGLARFRHEPKTPRAEFRIAIAGPAASFFLAIGFAAVAVIVTNAELNILGTIAFFLALWNFLLAVFNLLPGYPLDGGRVVRAYLWRRGTDLNEATVTTGRYGQIIAATLIVVGVIFLLFSKDGFFSGFWTIVVGIFLFDAASGIIRQVNEFEHMTVEEAMQLPITVEPEMSLMRFVDEVLPMHRRTVFLVAAEREFYGVLMLEDFKSLEREKWRETQVKTVMRPVAPEYFIETTAMLGEAKILMRENGIGALGVINTRGELVGFLQRGRLRKRS